MEVYVAEVYDEHVEVLGGVGFEGFSDRLVVLIPPLIPRTAFHHLHQLLRNILQLLNLRLDLNIQQHKLALLEQIRYGIPVTIPDLERMHELPGLKRFGLLLVECVDLLLKFVHYELFLDSEKVV